MSYFQAICENGHQYDYNHGDKSNCKYCGASWHVVNEVSGDSEQGYITSSDWKKFVLYPAKKEMVEGKTSISPEVLRLPSKQELSSFRTVLKNKVRMYVGKWN